MKQLLTGSLLSVLFLIAAAASQEPVAETKTNYAVVNLKNTNGVTEGESELITDRLRSELFNTGRVNVMERGQMQEILKEQGFQQSGACTDEACLVEMGQMLGVKVLVVGSLGKLGSMFLVNVRSIDVQTAQIIKVVSIDIKGDIEEVVGHLREIAEKLAGTNAPSTSAPTPTKPPAVAVTESTPTPDTAITASAPVEQADNIEEKPVIDSKTDRNRNRGGIGLSFTLLPGNYRHKAVIDTTTYDDEILLKLDMDEFYDRTDSLVGIDEKNYSRTTSPMMDFIIRFKIRIGDLFTIDIGPHLLYGSESYESAYFNYSELLELTYTTIGAQVGFNFVKRFFPLKINAGIFADFSVPIIYYTYTEKTFNATYNYFETSSASAANVTFKVIPGARAGAEIMAGPHIGFSADFVFQLLNLDADFDFDELDLDYYDLADDVTQTIGFPLIGLGMGVNFYF